MKRKDETKMANKLGEKNKKINKKTKRKNKECKNKWQNKPGKNDKNESIYILYTRINEKING